MTAMTAVDLTINSNIIVQIERYSKRLPTHLKQIQKCCTPPTELKLFQPKNTREYPMKSLATQGKRTYADRSIYDGEWQHGMRHGKVTFPSKYGNTVIG